MIFPMSEMSLVDVTIYPERFHQVRQASPRPVTTYPTLRAALFPFLVVSARLVSYCVSHPDQWSTS